MFRRVNVINLFWEEKMINFVFFIILGMLIGNLKLIFWCLFFFLEKNEWVEKDRYVFVEELVKEGDVGWGDVRERGWRRIEGF